MHAQLKAFSDKLIARSTQIGEDLQQLIYEEQRCQNKYENALMGFLILENSQFIENVSERPTQSIHS